MNMKNLILLVCDSLRYDQAHLMDLDFDYETRVIKSYTRATGTIDGLASILSGTWIKEGEVTSEEPLEKETFPEFFNDYEFFQSPEIGNTDPNVENMNSTPRSMLGFGEGRIRGPEELEEPFCFMKMLYQSQMLQRQKPQVRKRLEKESPEKLKEWTLLAKNAKDYEKRYYVALGRLRERIDDWISKLDLEENQFIITSDHGELFEDEIKELSEEKFGRKNEWAHGVDHEKVHEVPLIPIPDWEGLPNEMKQIEIFEHMKKRWRV